MIYTYDCIINLNVELSNIVLFHEVADYMEGCSFLRNAGILKLYTVCKIWNLQQYTQSIIICAVQRSNIKLEMQITDRDSLNMS